LIIELESIRAELKYIPKEVISQKGKDISISADTLLNKRIKKWIQAKTDYPVLSEEDKNQMNFLEYDDFLWIIDPLDGSLNYYRSIPIACISIALWKKNQPILGVVCDLNLNEIFIAVSEKTDFSDQVGAWLNSTPIGVSKIKNVNEAVICTGFPSSRQYDTESLIVFSKRLQQWQKVRLLGSAALSLAWVGCGRVDAYVEEDIRIWDVAAGLAIVKAAGGDIQLHSSKKKNYVTARASNGKISLNRI